MQRIKEFFKRPATIAVLALTVLYVVCMGGIFWGTWSLDRAPVEPDNPTFYPINELAQWFQALVAGHDFVPSDLMHVLGGMYFWQELQYALAGYLAALGLMFYLRGRGLSHFAAAAGGGAYGLMGYTFTLFSAGHLGWFIWMMYGPFAFGLADRAVRKGKWRNWALLGAVLAWGAARQPDMWLLFTALTFAYGVWTLVREWKNVKFSRILAGVGVTAVVACAIGMPQFTRALTQDLAGREAQIAATSGKDANETVDKSADERWRFCTSWSLPPEDTLEFIVAEVHGGSNDPRVSPTNPYRGRLGQQIVVPAGAAGQKHPVTGETLKAGETIWMPYRQHSLYFGVLTVLFALVGIVGWWRYALRKSQAADHEQRTTFSDVPFWVGAGILMYLCALGCFTPFYKLVYALPFGGSLRAPVKFVHLLEFCVAALAGFGFEAVWRGFKREGTAPFGVKAVLVVLAVVNIGKLAYVDSKYCAAEDVSFMHLPNAAADDVLAAGGGKVFVAVEPKEGGRILRDSLGVHLVEVSDDPSAPDIRYFLVNGTTLRKDKAFNEWVRSGRLKSAGMYAFSLTAGVTRAPGSSAQLALFENPSVPAPTPKDVPTPNRGRQALLLVSVLATFGLLAWGASGAVKWRRSAV